MFYKLVNQLKAVANYTTILIIIAVGLFTLLVDGKTYKQKGYIRELKLIRVISYSYITIGGLMFILMLFM
ncbi:CLC_0170 family protein [Tissierella sp.]|uniref:CLC_0170 family protein n=1 Tax=Tissierella sp. TaxID=41274 RepID=UPI00286178DB|nr:CLC_0170 family protein [Tissierella sp.]MDR7857583.1 CLC_0170 family protein [Tissierella sp.]